MPPERVPDPLRQKFLPHDGGYELEYSKHLDYPEGSDCEVQYLMNCNGEFTQFVALYYLNNLSIRRISEAGLESHYLFNEELNIKDIGYFRNSDDQLCLLVALNSTNISIHPHCIAYLRWNGAQFQLVQKIALEQEICCLRVIADEQSMPQLTSKLHRKMAIWPHIVAVGTHFAGCYLFNFPSPDQYKGHDPCVPTKIKLTDGLRPFRDGDEFVYSTEGGHSEKRLKSELVSVTCISFLEKCRVVLVGFSFGGIMSISLTVNPTIDPLIYPCSAPVQFIAPLEPDDDPRMHLWFFVAYSSTKAKPPQLCLFEVVFAEEESLPLSQRTWVRPRFGTKLVIPFYNTSRWISLQTLVRERSEFRGFEDSSRESTGSSSRLGSDKDRSVVFFSYVTDDKNDSNLKGGLFDLNAYFYKRLVHVITHDGTIAQQCAFMSMVQPIPMHYKQEDFSLLKDIAVDPSLITRFISNVSDAEQMFYPSAFEIAVVHVAGSEKCYQLSLPSLQNQLLSTICADLDMHIADPSSASQWLTALGFCKNSLYLRERETHDKSTVLCLVLSTLLSHQRAGAIVHYIKHSDPSQSRHLIAAWIWEEIDKAAKKLHETTEPLFARFSGPLSPAGQRALAHVHDVFVGGVQILKALISSVEQDETKEFVTTLEARRFAAESLRSYSTVIHQLMSSRILPVAEDRAIRLALGNLLNERRAKALGQLNIDKLVSRMQRRCPTEPFWHAEGPQWYPPALLNLLSPILVLHIPIKWKGQLLAYYLLDYAYCRTSHNGGSELIQEPPFLETVKKQMHGILDMSKSDIQNVYNMWCADGGQVFGEEGSVDNPSEAQHESTEAEVQKLLKIPRPLSSIEENRLKTLLKPIPFGEFAWNCYLAKHRRFDEVAELPVPPNADNNEAVLEYQQLLPLVKTLRRSLPYSSTKGPSWPNHIKEAIEKFENEKSSSLPSREIDIPIFNQGKTPVRLLRRQSNADAQLARKRPAAVALQQLTENSPQISSLSERTPPVAKRALMDLSEDDNIIPTDIPINTLNNIADILRTPKARACAAAHAESQRKWTDRTPEAEPERPAPRSILKSAKTERGTQPRSRLRFDLSPAPLSSTGQQTVSSATSSPEVLGRMAQPNFDESLEYGDDTTNSEDGAVEVQDEPFVPLVSPDPNEDVMPEEEPLYNSPASQDNDDVLEHSVEVQDEEDTEEGQEPATSVPPPLVEEEQDDDEYAVCVEEQPDIDEPSHREERSLSKHIEKQDEIMANGSCIVSVQESNDEVEKEGAMEVEDLEIGNSVEVQEEAHEANDVVHVTRLDSAVNASISPPRSSPSLPSSVAEVASGPVADEQAAVETQSEFDGAVSDQCVDDVDIAIERQSDMDEEVAIERQSDDLDFGDHETAVGGDKNSHELQEDVMDATFTLPDATFTLPAPSCLANGDFVSLVAESVTTVAEDRTDEICDVKLVDYSFTSDSTFDRTHTPKKLQKAPDTTDHSLIRKTLEFDREVDSMFDPDQLVHPIVDECSSETQSSPRLPSSPAEFVTKCDSQGMASPKRTAGATPEVVEMAAATPSPPPHMSDSDVVPASTRRNTRSSAKKGARAAPPATPTRQSRRLRNRSVSVDDENSEKGSDVTSVVSKSPPPSNDNESTTSHLTMSSRRRTRKTSNSSAATAPIEESGTPSKTESKFIASSSAIRRSLRKRTPSQAQQEQHPSAASVKSSRRSRKLNESVEETEQKPAEVVQKSPGRGGRTRKVSTASSEASSSVPKSPTRRTPTRSMTKPKPVDVEQQGSKRKGTLPKAARALSEKFTIPKQLGGMDAATLFDMTMEGKSFRRRSLSDSVVSEVKAKRSRTQIVDTIAEATEEPGSVTSEQSEAVDTEDVFDAPQPSAVEKLRTPTRQRRAASATPAELTPSRTAARKEPKSPSRKHSMASSDEPTSSAPKSPSRRTPTRSITKSKLLEVEQASSKLKGSRSKAVRALSEKISIPKPLGGIDARTFFDMSMSDTSTRNRTLSDSIVHDVEEKRTRTNKIVGAIMEVDEGSGSVSSHSSGDKSGSGVQQISAAENMQSSSRTRRAKSATPVDLTPTRMRTRKASDSLIPNTSETPKSPSRRGRSSKIQTIPE